MNLQDYRKLVEKRRALEPSYRTLCMTCRQPDFRCYCRHIQSFDPRVKFVILIHPIEVKRPIASGRMSHLILEGSELILGYDYSGHSRIDEIIADPTRHSVVLYPGRSSVNITPLSQEEKSSLFPPSKKLVIFVIDGTWNTAKKTMHVSENLKALPQICFSPPGPSRFRVRVQPKPECYSTLEAIHHTLELIGPSQGLNTQLREHDALLSAFDAMVEKQFSYVKINNSRHRKNSAARRALTQVAV